MRSVQVPEEYNLYGTKIGLVVQTLKDIHKNDPKAKCLVYCQWDSLKNKVPARSLRRQPNATSTRTRSIPNQVRGWGGGGDRTPKKTEEGGGG